MKIDEISKVCFVGAGTMGCFNSLMASAAGYQSVIYDVSPEALSSFHEGQQEMAAYLVESGFFLASDIEVALSLVSVDSDIHSAVDGAQLVSESVVENLEIKKDLHRLLDSICAQSTLITTNTSNLLVSDIEGSLVRSERFAALHSHLGSRLIDIVGSSKMSGDSVELLKRYVCSVGGIPLVLGKENPGYVLNAILGPLLTIGMILVILGRATIEEVDRAWMVKNKASIGPFGMMDMFGINVVYDNWNKARSDEKAKTIQPLIMDFLQPFIDGGWLGIKSAKGFYEYPDPSYADQNFATDNNGHDEIFEAMLVVLIQNAIGLVRKQVVDTHEVDRAWMAATGLERGPFGWLDTVGLERFMEIQDQQVASGLSTAESAKSVELFLKPFIEEKKLGEKSGEGFYSYPGPAYRSKNFIEDGL